jgi:CBS domain-containing protein
MRTVADAMASPPVSVPSAATIQEASAAMLDAHAHAGLVVDDGFASGLVTAEDVARALADGRDPGATSVREIADPDPPVVRSDEPLAEVHDRMRAAAQEVVAVADRNGRPVGLLFDPEARG